MRELLVKYIKGDCTDEEKVDIATWIDFGPENMKEYLALRKLHDITIWQTFPVSKPALKSKGRASIWLRSAIYTEVLKIAAVFIVAILVSRYLFPEAIPNSPVAVQTLHVPAGERAEITLEDGTKVWLNAKTTLIFPNQFSGQTREVQLDGEGFFDVTPNKSKPFVVKTKNYGIKVWGTKFNLMAYSEKKIFETSLLEGTVEVLSSNDEKGIMLRPNERIFVADTHLTVAPIEHMNHFLWREGIISFEDETFPEMVNKLELYFDLKMVVKNSKILKYRCTGKFRTKDGVEHILKVLQLSNKFNYTIDEMQNVITIQ